MKIVCKICKLPSRVVYRRMGDSWDLGCIKCKRKVSLSITHPFKKPGQIYQVDKILLSRPYRHIQWYDYNTGCSMKNIIVDEIIGNKYEI